MTGAAHRPDQACGPRQNAATAGFQTASPPRTARWPASHHCSPPRAPAPPARGPPHPATSPGRGWRNRRAGDRPRAAHHRADNSPPTIGHVDADWNSPSWRPCFRTAAPRHGRGPDRRSVRTRHPPPHAWRQGSVGAGWPSGRARNKSPGWCRVLFPSRTAGRPLPRWLAFAATAPGNHSRTHRARCNPGFSPRRPEDCRRTDNNPDHGPAGPPLPAHPVGPARAAAPGAETPAHVGR